MLLWGIATGRHRNKSDVSACAVNIYYLGITLMGMLNVKSLAENLSFKDIIFSLIPTAATYSGYAEGYLNGFLPAWLLENPYGALALTVLLFLGILFVLYLVNQESRARSISEILATGYFLNFAGKLTTLLKQRSDVTFLKDEGPVAVAPHNIRLTILLPASYNQLKAIRSSVEETTDIAYVGEKPFDEPRWWLNIRRDGPAEEVQILEFPRTLFALPNYLGKDFTEKASQKWFNAFNEKFRQLIEDHPDKIPAADRFNILIQ